MRIPITRSDLKHFCILRGILKSDTRDVDSDPTTTLRTGLLLARLENGHYVDYDQGINGRIDCMGILMEDVDLLDVETREPMDTVAEVLWKGSAPKSIMDSLEKGKQLIVRGILKEDTL